MTKQETNGYFTVLIPWTDHSPTKWHPTKKEGALSLGAFSSYKEAEDWAKKKVPGHRYDIKEISDGKEKLANPNECDHLLSADLDNVFNTEHNKPKLRPVTFEECDISVHAIMSDIPVRGNAMASDDADFDERFENDILSELNSGNIWVWADVEVTASWGSFVTSGLSLWH